MLTDETVNTATVSKFLTVSPHRIRQLTAEGVLERALDKSEKPMRGRFNLLGTVNSYIYYLRSKLTAKGAGSGDEYAVARAERMRSLADLEKLRLRKIRGELHRTGDIEFCLTRMITACRGRLLVLPSRCCGILQGRTQAEVAAILRKEIETALSELAEFNPVGDKESVEAYLAAKSSMNGDGATHQP
jgi:phage terminase Nu1 subunit (DNA packaging protein)